jgi:hypothetical protein
VEEHGFPFLLSKQNQLKELDLEGSFFSTLLQGFTRTKQKYIGESMLRGDRNGTCIDSFTNASFTIPQVQYS